VQAAAGLEDYMIGRTKSVSKISLLIADVDCSLVTEGKVLTTARVRHYRLHAE
jgi:hypothetical protein